VVSAALTHPRATAFVRNTPAFDVQTRSLAQNGQMRRLKAGMVGGGPGAMIGAAHRHAMWLDNQYDLTAGIFGRNATASKEFAKTIGVERVYADYRDMAKHEAGRLDVVAVVTPNDSHFEIDSERKYALP
jgi:Oxidoreductase family, NAD-binding Rossmann fold